MTAANPVPAVKLGDELSVSAIGFGAMALTPVYGNRFEDMSWVSAGRESGT